MKQSQLDVFMLRRHLIRGRWLPSLIFAVALLFVAAATGYADHSSQPESVTIAGTVQSQIGCSGDWEPPCEASMLTFDSETNLWHGTFALEAGSYEYKVAINGTWGENYGQGGVADGPNIPLFVPSAGNVTFTYDHETHLVTDSTGGDVPAVKPPPDFVTIPGTIQEQLGCSGDWQPDCENSFLTLGEDGVWRGTFALLAGEYEYKVAINRSWGENYGLNAEKGGANIPLSVPTDQEVTFYYDHETGWVADNINYLIPVVIGDFQDELGCPADFDPTCLASWLRDPDGDGIYAVTTVAEVPAGSYTAQLTFDQNGDEVGDEISFDLSEPTSLFMQYDAELDELTISTDGAPKGNLGEARAHWITADTIAWDVDSELVAAGILHYAANGGLKLGRDGLGGSEIMLTVDPSGLPQELIAKFPHLATFTVFKLNPDQLDEVRIALKGQVAVSAVDEAGSIVDAASMQIPGVLDDLYQYDGALGVTLDEGVPTVRVWAPTARGVRFHLYNSANEFTASESFPMRVDPRSGVWTIEGDASWVGKYYLFEVTVYVRAENGVVTNMVTDPYSISLSMNSARSHIIDLEDDDFAPAGWNSVNKPTLNAPEDIVVYELHVRDFSAHDQSVSPEYRGTYMAFTELASSGMQHLSGLADAGLTHVHLLPTFDIATINEDKSTWETIPFEALAAYPPDSEEQQAIVTVNRSADPFNWGYDPFHYNVPEGSYATNPNDGVRVMEYRSMVQALNAAGLRVVVDVVYNHTNAAGQSENSVLDKIVPGYYHRLSATGNVERSTCCANTATEHRMMRKLMVDSVLLWATTYKVDGFRFDLMGHHMVEDMLAVRAALDSLTMAEHGVDGASIYVYGEGWNFGEVANNARGRNGTQINMAGSGIGSFNDRLRDAVRGGNPFGGFFEQGFINGLFYDPNEQESRPDAIQRLDLLHFADQIRVGLAGNLAEYAFVDMSGSTVTGAEVDYNGAPAGYTADPQEHIVYISAHDNETLFDAIQAKAPADATLDERVRMHNMGISLVALSQGVPFFHAGTELLRSKSFDRDSYDSGDWFNRLDFTYSSSGYGIGLPPAEKNQDKYDILQPLLARVDLVPQQAHILQALSHMHDMLAIRADSLLFRLRDAEQVGERVTFHNTGPEQLPGVILMSITDFVGDNLDPQYDAIVVMFNATTSEQSLTIETFAGTSFELHPVLAASDDAIVGQAAVDGETGRFTAPPRTTAVFVLAEGSIQPMVEEADSVNEDEAAQETDTAEPGDAEEDQSEVSAEQLTDDPTEDTVTEEDSGGIGTALWVTLAVLAVGVGGFFAMRLGQGRKESSIE